ncbi:MAG: Holliday junction resolvase RuvX [Clostridiales bacterium]|nr:Holliday junction resolvase RuvX [Clostridiales bacterium]
MARILGLDVGDKRIGIALSDERQIIASPHSVYHRIGYGPDSRYFLGLAQEQNVAYIVAGLPFNMNGSLGPQALKVQEFCQQLVKAGLRVEFIDERLTTKSAEMALIQGGMRREDRKETVDKIAAALILQSYLDSNAKSTPVEESLKSTAHDHQEEYIMDKTNKDLPENEVEVMEEEYESNIVELTDEDGETTAFEYQATLEYEGQEYVVLMLAEEDEEEEDEDGSVIIMKIEEDENGEDTYVTVDDEEVAQKVFDLFLEYLDEEEEGEE